MRRTALIVAPMIVLGLLLAPAWAEDGFQCRFDVACVAGGCDPSDAEIEIARSENSDAWIFLTAESGGAEARALSDPGDEVQVFVLHDPAFSTIMMTLYPNGRAVYSNHNVSSATDVTTGYGFCEGIS